jgi:uncharacterized repeat protein (TIGR03943 family)
VNRMGRATIMLFVGAIAVRLAWTGEFGAFLQQRMRWPLLLGGVILVALGMAEAVRADIERRDDAGASRRSVAPSVGWLLVVPMLVLISVAPTALGASAVDRTDGYRSTEREAFAPLPGGPEPAPLTFLEFVDRAVWDRDESLRDRPVLLRGFVVNDERTPDGFVLTRFAVACCAADALPVQVAIGNVATPLPDDTWIDAVVVWRAPPEPYDLEEPWIVEADLLRFEVLPAPPDAPYESPY